MEDLDEEIMAILSIISADLEQVHSDVDDDATTPNSPTAIDNVVETAGTDNMQPRYFFNGFVSSSWANSSIARASILSLLLANTSTHLGANRSVVVVFTS